MRAAAKRMKKDEKGTKICTSEPGESVASDRPSCSRCFACYSTATCSMSLPEVNGNKKVPFAPCSDAFLWKDVPFFEQLFATPEVFKG